MDGQRPCPFCAEPIKLEAIKCKHCGEMMPGEVRPPAPADSPAAKDEEHLGYLALAHTVIAVLTVLFGSMFLIHFGIGLVSIIAPEKMSGGKPGNMPPPFFGWIFLVVGALAVTGFWTIAGLMFAAGRFIKRRKRHLFCIIVAGLSLLIMPFGTALGVSTFLVLNRPSVKALFQQPPKAL